MFLQHVPTAECFSHQVAVPKFPQASTWPIMWCEALFEHSENERREDSFVGGGVVLHEHEEC